MVLGADAVRHPHRHSHSITLAGLFRWRVELRYEILAPDANDLHDAGWARSRNAVVAAACVVDSSLRDNRVDGRCPEFALRSRGAAGAIGPDGSEQVPMKKHGAPIIAAVFLVLPMLYLGTYFALVVPGQQFTWGNLPQPPYRFGGRAAAVLFWPLEQIDRKVRPWAWEAIAQ
jgi:hypothetical protein